MSIRPGVAVSAAMLLAMLLCSTRGTLHGKLIEDEVAPVQQVVIVPFQNLDDPQAPSPIGAELADSVTNTLNQIPGISVLGQDILRREAQTSGMPSGLLKPEDALLLARKMGANTLVAGTFKKIGSGLQADCWIVDVDTGQTLDGKNFSHTEEFPGSYPALLHFVPDAVEKLLRPASASTSLPKPQVSPAVANAFEDTSSNYDAHQQFSEGIEKVDVGTPESLGSAVASFQQALKTDSEFAQAFVGKADAELKLSKLRDYDRDFAAADVLRKDALEDAMTAVKKAPYFGGAHWQLSRALTATGDYNGGARAARVAAQLWPASGEVQVDLSRALGHGKLVEGPELTRAMKMAPSLVLVTQELPKVTVLNAGTADVTVTFEKTVGRFFVSMTVPAGGSRIVGIVPGSYKVTAVRGGDTRSETRDFTEGTIYSLDGRTLISETSQVKEKVGPATLAIRCNVLGAYVSVNGIRVGRAPMDWVVDSTTSSEWMFKLVISADGYESYNKEWHANPGSVVPIRATLAHSPTLNLMNLDGSK